MSVPDIKLTKPLLRGHSHQAAFFVALGACGMLLFHSHGIKNIISTLIYSISLCGLFGISAIYHRPMWQPQQRLWMKRLDHAAIYMLIAGTSTPFCLLALTKSTGIFLLEIVWGAALFGIFQSLVWTQAPKWISAILYVTMGCLILPFLPDLKQSLSMSDLLFILGGGLVYVVGAVIYALKWPNPNPKIFGYHEIFHLLVIVGALAHFMAVASLIH